MTEKQYIATLVIEPEGVRFRPITLMALDDDAAIKEMDRRLKLHPPPIDDEQTTVRVGIVCQENGANRVVHQFVFNKRN